MTALARLARAALLVEWRLRNRTPAVISVEAPRWTTCDLSPEQRARALREVADKMRRAGR